MPKGWLVVVAVLVCGLSAAAQVPGCPDPLATNYTAVATTNNGSCVYASATVVATTSAPLSATLSETSGLIKWGNSLLTHNDNSDTNLYALDTVTAAITQTFVLPGVANQDWEELAQDTGFIYIGDFGNNVNGNRSNLHILRVSKSSLLAGSPVTDTISFSYSNQTSLAPTGPNNTDFDCEAFVVSADSIYLFTKQWVTNSTSVYVLPKTPGTHTAALKATHAVQGLITGATYLELQKLVVLCGYSNTLQPFLYLLYDFTGHHFFSGNKRKINLALPFYQVEGLTTTNGLNYYLTNEYFTQPPLITSNQKLHQFNLSPFLNQYLNPMQVSAAQELHEQIFVYPNPVQEVLRVKVNTREVGAGYTLTDCTGRTVASGLLSSSENSILLNSLPGGLYLLHIQGKANRVLKVIKE